MGLGGLFGCLCPSLGARARGRLHSAGDPDARSTCTSLERVNLDFFIRQPKQADVELLAYLVLAREDADVADGSAASEVFSVAFASGSLLSHLGCSSRQDYLARLGAWLAADAELADQFARLVRCAANGCVGMVVYPLEDGVQLHDGVYNLSLTVKSCLVVDAAAVLSPDGSGLGRPALAVSHKLSRLDDLSAMRQQEMALTTIPAIVTALLLDGRVVYQNPRSQQYMGNLVSSYVPPTGTSLTSLTSSNHPLKRLFKLDPEALQAFEAAMATETEFRRVVKVPKRIKQPQHGGGAGGGALSPGRRARTAGARDRNGSSRLVRQVSGVGRAATAGAGIGLGQDHAGGGGGYGRNAGGSIRSGRSGLVSREASMPLMSHGASGRTALAGSSRRGMLSGADSTAASRRSSLLMMQQHGAAGAAAGGGAAAPAAAAVAASGAARRSVRRCTSVMNLAGRAGLPSPASPYRPGTSNMVSRTPSFLGMGVAGAGPGQQRHPPQQPATSSPKRHEPRTLKPPSVAASPVRLTRVAEDQSPSGSVAAVGAPGRPSGVATWTAGLPHLEPPQAGGSGGDAAAAAAAAPTVAPLTVQAAASSADLLCDLPSGTPLSSPLADAVSQPSPGEGDLASGSLHHSITLAPPADPNHGRLLAAAAAASAAPAHLADGTPQGATAAAPPPQHGGQQARLRPDAAYHLVAAATGGDGGGGAAAGTGVAAATPSSLSARSAFTQVSSVDSAPSSPKLQVGRSAQPFACGATGASPLRPSQSQSHHQHHSSRRNSSSTGHSRPFAYAVGADAYRPVDSGASTGLGLGLGLGLGGGNEEGATERISFVSSTRSSRAGGRRGSFIVLGAAAGFGSVGGGIGALAASASAAFRRSTSADPLGLTAATASASAASSRKGTGTGMLNAPNSSGASSSSTATSPRTAHGRVLRAVPGGGGAAAFFRSHSVELHSHADPPPRSHPPDAPKTAATAASAVAPPPPPLVAAAAVSLVEVTPTFMDANGREVEGVANDTDAAVRALRQYAAAAAGGGGARAAPGLRSSGGPRVAAGLAAVAARDGLAAGSAAAGLVGAAGPLLACVASPVGGSAAGGSPPSFRSSVHLLSSIQEEGGEQRGSKEDYGPSAAAAAAVLPPLAALAPSAEANWWVSSCGGGVRPQTAGSGGGGGGGPRSAAVSMLLECGELEASSVDPAAAEGVSLMFSHLNSSGGGIDRLTSGHNVPLPSLNLGMASGMLDGLEGDLSYGGGGGSSLGSGAFRGFGAVLAGMARADGHGHGHQQVLPGNLSAQFRLGAARFAHAPAAAAAAVGGSGGSAAAAATAPARHAAAGAASTAGSPGSASAARAGMVPSPAGMTPSGEAPLAAGAHVGPRAPAAAAASSAAEAGTAAVVWQEGPAAAASPSSEHHGLLQQPQQQQNTEEEKAAGGPDGPVGQLSHGPLQLPSAPPLQLPSATSVSQSSRHPSAASPFGDGASQDTASSQLVKVAASSPSPRSGFTSLSQIAAADGAGGGGGGGGTDGGDGAGERHGVTTATVVSDFGMSSGGFAEMMGTTQMSVAGGQATGISTLTDGEDNYHYHYQDLVSLSPTAPQVKQLFPARHGGGGTNGGGGGGQGGPGGGDAGDAHRTWAAGDSLDVGGAGGGAAASNTSAAARYGSFTVERCLPEAVASGISGAVTCPAPSIGPTSADSAAVGGVGPVSAGGRGRDAGGGGVGGSSLAGTLTGGTASGMMALTSNGMAAGTGTGPRVPALRRRNTKDRLMSLLTSLSRDESDEEEPGDDHEWHDVYACVRVEGATGRTVAVITQTEVTEQVRRGRRGGLGGLRGWSVVVCGGLWWYGGGTTWHTA
ncbi:hypothetical protein PLESTM_000655600 [Pleodorina starrii]|nr:hypothetical protein PLESTM_000655600 [Pleodorina starrii]